MRFAIPAILCLGVLGPLLWAFIAAPTALLGTTLLLALLIAGGLGVLASGPAGEIIVKSKWIEAKLSKAEENVSKIEELRREVEENKAALMAEIADLRTSADEAKALADKAHKTADDAIAMAASGVFS